MKASVVIRTLNEDQYLDELFQRIHSQDSQYEVEVVLVDSGSTDQTLSIAEKHNANIVHIKKSEFSFGRSLNMGCEAATGDFLIFVSGHCVPVDDQWLEELLAPFQSHEDVAYTYGRQVGGPESKFSEIQLFNKYFPETSKIPQEGFFCNNANSALRKADWEINKFDEELTGLEDMHLAKELVQRGRLVAYVAEASVYHFHHETWKTVKRRYEREAIALQHIMPEIHLSFVDIARYFTSAVLHDSATALEQKQLGGKLGEIVQFRFMQFLGAYKGNHEHRQLSRQKKETYFYPKNV